MLSHVFLNSQLTQEFFAGFTGESVEPKDVFLAFTVDQGGNVVNACGRWAWRSSSATATASTPQWSLGVAGSATTCKTKPMGALMKKLAACVGVWSHSAVNNDKLKDIQRQLEEDFHEIYELLRRNDTRCDYIYLFERSEFLIATSQKKICNLCVCRVSCVRLILVLVWKKMYVCTWYQPATQIRI